MPTNKYNTNERERPLMVWIVQFLLLFICIGTLISIWSSYGLCATPKLLENCLMSGGQPCENLDILESCWSGFFLPEFLRSLGQLIVLLGLFYGLEKGLPYGRWLAGIVIIAWAFISIQDMTYIQLIFRAMEPGKGLHTPPYECWNPVNSWSDRIIFCGYDSYGQLARKVLWEVVILTVQMLSGLWFIVDPGSKRYFARKHGQGYGQ